MGVRDSLQVHTPVQVLTPAGARGQHRTSSRLRSQAPTQYITFRFQKLECRTPIREALQFIEIWFGTPVFHIITIPLPIYGYGNGDDGFREDVRK